MVFIWLCLSLARIPCHCWCCCCCCCYCCCRFFGLIWFLMMKDLKRRKKNTQTTKIPSKTKIYYTHTHNFTFMLLLALIIMLCGIRSLSAAKFISFTLSFGCDNSIVSPCNSSVTSNWKVDGCYKIWLISIYKRILNTFPFLHHHFYTQYTSETGIDKINHDS